MHYFMSDIHGNAKAYFEMKEYIQFSKEDELYILGDILDGNRKHPEQCLRILDDIMENDNITLLLGDHEYAHVMYRMADGEVKAIWKNIILEAEFGGKPLMEYLERLPDKTCDKYMSYLLEQEISKVITIGGRSFYLVHGAPALMKTKDICSWQRNVVIGVIDLKLSYEEEMRADPGRFFEKRRYFDDVVIICGHVPTREFLVSDSDLEEAHWNGAHSEYQKVLFVDNKLVIDCGCLADKWEADIKPTLACVAVDEVGYTVVYHKDIWG